MSEKNITDSPAAPPVVACSDLLAGCECMHWASARLDIQVLTGHHENCPKGGNLEESYKRLVAALVKGMENWAADEDGIHPDAWEAYKRGKCVIGQYDWKEEPAS